MPDVLVVYASKHGHAGEITERIGEALRAEGLNVERRAVADVGGTSPADYNGAIVGGSLHAGHHQRELVDWVKHHRLALESRPSLFVSVSLTAADDTDEARSATQACIDEFIEDTGWNPTRSAAVAGALQYREYDVFTRVLMRLIARRHGQPTDTSHDYDYTDWEDVDRIAREFAADVTAAK
jgi:menaquinone-dependent protoporphyrinogen oxidase